MNKSSQRNKTINFHQWSRKAYAVFASLGREVKICRLSVGMCEKAILKLDNQIKTTTAILFLDKEEEVLNEALIDSQQLCLCLETSTTKDIFSARNTDYYIKRI